MNENILQNIKTQRLTARRITPSDLDSIQIINTDLSNSVYACYDKPKETNPELIKAKAEKLEAYKNSMEHMFFAVCLNDTMIGFAAFNQTGAGYEIGYGFHSRYHGKGYAKESISALIAAVLRARPDAEITAGTALNNTPSVRLLQSLDFEMTGTEPVSFYKDAEGNDIYFEGGIFKLKGK